MNTTWLTLSNQRRVEILNQATEFTGLPATAIEKDWWVTLCLSASFNLPYSGHFPDKIRIIPPDTVIKDYENDYTEMTKFMIYGESLPFDGLIKRITELQSRINKMGQM